MVKVTGPIHSIAATGSIGGAITFATWKGRPYVRELVKPKNPDSEKQHSVRLMLKYLSTYWTKLTLSTQNDWAYWAQPKNLSTFNAYIGKNLNSWRTFQGISKLFNFPRDLSNANAGVATAVGGTRLITITLPITNAQFSWCAMIFRKLAAPVTPAFDNLVAIRTISGTDDLVFVDTALEPGTYHYDFYLNTITGKFDAESQPISATATA